jgi:chromosome partitioning protein
MDDIVIDGPPRVNDLARAAIMAADIVTHSGATRPYDVRAATEIVELLSEASAFKEKQKFAFVINRKIVNTAIGRDVAEALAGYAVPVFAATVPQRVAVAESAAQGCTVLEIDPQGVARQEINRLVDELLTLNTKRTT